jgi:hypothetical protein
MTDDIKLADDEVWQPDGHLSDVAITALSDGEDSLLPAHAVAHASSCDPCSARLAEHALLSVSLSESLAVRAPTSSRVERPLPVAALMAAFVLALVGATPTLVAAPPWLESLPTTLVRTGPLALRLLSSMLKVTSSDAGSMVIVWATASVVLAALGLFVTRLAPREVAWKGARK